MGAGGHPPGDGRHQGRRTDGCGHAEAEDVGTVEAPKTTRKGHSSGPAERSEVPGGPTGRDSSVIVRYRNSPKHTRAGVIVGGKEDWVPRAPMG